jgi:hypothetical protein
MLGTGVVAGYGMALFRWGPCGPSDPWGLILLLVALVSLATGLLLSLIGLVKMVVQRTRRAAIS